MFTNIVSEKYMVEITKFYKIILLKSHVNLRSQEMEHIHIM